MDGQITNDRLIIVPLDGSAYADAAIPYAAEVAAGGGALALIRVLPDVAPYQILWRSLAESPMEASRRFQGAALRWLRQKAASCTRAYGVPTDAAIAVGEPAAAILRHARDRDAAMIVMASAGFGALDPHAFGSVADRLIRQSPVPVLIVRPDDGSTSEIRRLVVPLDGSRRAATVLPVAADLARHLGVPVALVTVIDPTRAVPPTGAYKAAIAGGFPEEVLAGLQAEAQRVVDEAAAELALTGTATARYVKYGNVASCIAAMCGAGDVIVMASHGGSHEGWPMGSVAGMLVRAAPVPVLMVRTAPPADLELMPVPEALPAASGPATVAGG